MKKKNRAAARHARQSALIEAVAAAVVRRMAPVLQTLNKLDKHEGYLDARRRVLEMDQHQDRDTSRAWGLIAEGEQAVAGIKQELAALLT
jgi:hypothetical protein